MTKKTSEPLRIGFWGCGMWARMTAAKIKNLDSINIAACFDPGADAAREFSEVASCKIAPSSEALLSSHDLEAVVVITPNDLHKEHVVEALARGLHVFVEKPMANSVADCQAMIRAAQQAGKVLMVGHNTRREARYRRARQMLVSGELGQPVTASMIFSSPGGFVQQQNSWRFDPVRCPALAVSQLGVHLFDLFSAVLGRPIAVQARNQCVALAPGIEDLCSGTTEHEGNVCANFTICYSTAHRRALEVMGTKGSYYTDETQTLFRRTDQPLKTEPLDIQPNDTVQEEFEEFARCCRTGEQPETDGVAGLQSVAMMNAVAQSAREGRRIELNWDELLGDLTVSHATASAK